MSTVPAQRHQKTQAGSGAPPLLAVEELRTWFTVRRGIFSRRTRPVRAVDGVSFVLQRGGTLGLVGESGCGKTTLGRTLLGLETPTGGKMLLDGREISTFRRRELKQMRKRVQVVFQDPQSSLNPRMNIMDIITEGLVQFKMIDGSRQEHAQRLVQEVGLDPDVIYRFPHEFSGGQRQRISIARAISLRPELVICDEAVSALDVSIKAQVINLLISLQKRHHLSYLFISHDLSVVSNIADRVAVMYMGQIVENGTTADIIKRPMHPYTVGLIRAIPVAGYERTEARRIIKGETPSPADPPPGCRFHTRCPEVMPVCRKTPPKAMIQDGHMVMCHLY